MSDGYNETESGGVTIGDIFHTILSQKWVALAVALVIFLAGTIGVYFGYSRNKSNYSISFTLSLPYASSTASFYELPDGSRFYYSDYVSESVLSEVAASDNDSFGYIDYVKMAGNNDITLKEDPLSDSEAQMNAVLNGDGEIVNVAPNVAVRGIFTISVKQKYFKDQESAKSFLTSLANYPIRRYLEANSSMNYNNYLNYGDFENALTFTDQLGYIEKQIEFIGSLYDALPSTVTIDDGTLVAAIQQSFKAWVFRIDLDAVINKADAYYYLKDYETQIEKYQDELFKAGGLYDNYNDAVSVFERFKESLTDIQTSTEASVIADLLKEIEVLKRQIVTYENYISAYYETRTDLNTGFLEIDETTGRIWLGEVNSAQVNSAKTYADEIKGIYESLTEEDGYINQFVELNDMVYRKISSVNYQIASVITGDGGVGLAITAVVSLIVGIIVACVVAYIVAVVKKNRTSAAIKGSAEPNGNAGTVSRADETIENEKD